MRYKRLILCGIVIGELLLFVFLGYNIYLIQRQRSSVLGAHVVTKIDIQSMTFPHPESLPNYYEPGPSHTDAERPDWLSYVTSYTYNSDGIRSVKEYPLQKDPDVFRIIALGDSFTFGQYVNEDDIYVTQLENSLNTASCSAGKKFEIINLGVPGYDIQYAVERYRRHGQKYHPDLVIWLVNQHNLYQIVDLLKPLQNQIEQAATKEEIAKYYAQHDYFFAYTQAQQMIEKKYGLNYIFSLQKKALQDFSSLYHGPLLVAMFATSDAPSRGLIETYVKERGHAYFNPALTPISQSNQNSLPDGHPNIQGHAMIAGQLFQYMKDQHILPCD